MILIFRHSVGTPPGLVQTFLQQNQLPHRTFFWTQDSLADLERIEPSSISWLIVLGGPQNVDETKQFPWLLQEKEWIRRYLMTRHQYLGLCLGGQLLAEAVGGSVERAPFHEVGWHPVTLRPFWHETGAQNTDVMQVFEYHSYRFHTPPDARSIAIGQNLPDQGFLWQDFALGLQFHPESEMTWVQECAGEREFPTSQTVQDPEQIIQQAQVHLPVQATWFWNLLVQQARRAGYPLAQPAPLTLEA